MIHKSIYKQLLKRFESVRIGILTLILSGIPLSYARPATRLFIPMYTAQRRDRTLSPEQEMTIIRHFHMEDRILNRQVLSVPPSVNGTADEDVSGEWICFTTMSDGQGIINIIVNQEGTRLSGILRQLSFTSRKPPSDAVLQEILVPDSDHPGSAGIAGEFRETAGHNIIVLHRKNNDNTFEATFSATVNGDGLTATGQLVNSGGNYGTMLMVRRQALGRYLPFLEYAAAGIPASSSGYWPESVTELEAAIEAERLEGAWGWFEKTDTDNDGVVSLDEFPKPVWHRANINGDASLTWEEELKWQYNTQIAAIKNLKPGINYSYYEGKWEKLPDIKHQTVLDSGIVSEFDISPAKQKDYIGIVYNGFIKIKNDGLYTFHTSSADGSKLWIGETMVVDNDKLHGARERAGKNGLQKDLHPIKVEFFEANLNENLNVSCEGPEIGKQLIPSEILFHWVKIKSK